MFKRELMSVITFYSISPIHAGSGSSTGAVDNPIQREVHTNWPVIQASAVKGAMRSHFRRFFDLDKIEGGKNELKNKNDFLNYIFGSDEQDDWDKNKENIPGAISVSDAKIIAMPVRSNVAPFVWVTSPTVLKRLKRDLEFAGINGINDDNNNDIPPVTNDYAIIIGNWEHNDKIILEDAIVNVKDENKEIEFFKNNFPDVDKLIIISDEMFKYVSENCTDIQAQIRIDEEKGTTEVGSLRYEEYLPADSLLYSVVYVSDSADKKLNAEGVFCNLKNAISDFIQLGGAETLGKGICKIKWINGGEKCKQ